MMNLYSLKMQRKTRSIGMLDEILKKNSLKDQYNKEE